MHRIGAWVYDGGRAGRAGWDGCRRRGVLGEVGGEEAERLALVGGQRRAVALEVAWDAAAGGTWAVAEGLNASLPLQLCGDSETERENVALEPADKLANQ